MRKRLSIVMYMAFLPPHIPFRILLNRSGTVRERCTLAEMACGTISP